MHFLLEYLQLHDITAELQSLKTCFSWTSTLFYGPTSQSYFFVMVWCQKSAPAELCNKHRKDYFWILNWVLLVNT